MKLELSGQILEKYSNNQISWKSDFGSQVIQCTWTDRQNETQSLFEILLTCLKLTVLWDIMCRRVRWFETLVPIYETVWMCEGERGVGGGKGEGQAERERKKVMERTKKEQFPLSCQLCSLCCHNITSVAALLCHLHTLTKLLVHTSWLVAGDVYLRGEWDAYGMDELVELNALD